MVCACTENITISSHQNNLFKLTLFWVDNIFMWTFFFCGFLEVQVLYNRIFWHLRIIAKKTPLFEN